jgi:hypothetical protein
LVPLFGIVVPGTFTHLIDGSFQCWLYLSASFHGSCRLGRRRQLRVARYAMEELAGRQIVGEQHVRLADGVPCVEDFAHLLALGRGVVAPQVRLAVLDPAHEILAPVAIAVAAVDVGEAGHARLHRQEDALGRFAGGVEAIDDVESVADMGLATRGQTVGALDRHIPELATALQLRRHKSLALGGHDLADHPAEVRTILLVLEVDAVQVRAAVALVGLRRDQAPVHRLSAEVVDGLADRQRERAHVASHHALVGEHGLQDLCLLNAHAGLPQDLQVLLALAELLGLVNLHLPLQRLV